MTDTPYGGFMALPYESYGLAGEGENFTLPIHVVH